ncbi:MAG: hypothetical protein HY542_04395, partial [Deltaproteobacteria bacterium]|nr:hypothetical protein [Deltaproteobacteria bacterium]
MSYTSWIKSGIASTLGIPESSLDGGVDLDRNGRVEGEELLEDSNQNGELGDYRDWVVYYQRKVRTRPEWNSHLGGIFRHATGSPLSPDNPIHDDLGIESRVVSPGDTKTTYAKISRVLFDVRGRDFRTGGRLSPQEKLRSIYQAIRDSGFREGDREDPLLTTAVRDMEVDCDSAALIVLAVAHEMGWPVSLVLAPHHAFVRWEETGLRFNMDLLNWGTSLTDQEYVDRYSITDQSLQNGVYLRSLDRDGLLGFALYRRGVVRINRINRQGDDKMVRAELLAAKRDITDALELDARNPFAMSDLAHI